MNVIPPLTITEGILTSSTVAEPDTGEIAWVSGTTYSVRDVRIYVATHRKYERLIAGAGTTSPNLDTTNWLDVGPTNKWAMFDLLRNSATSKASPLTTVLTPAVRTNSVAVLSTNAESITVTVVSGGTTVYTRTTSMLNRRTTGWYDYFFEEMTTTPNMILFDLPPYTNAVITITQTRAAGNIICGACVIGNYVHLGSVQYNASNDTLNFSSVTRDDFGNATMVPRRNIPKTNQELLLEVPYINKAIALRDTLDAVPAVWSGLEDSTSDNMFESLLILGFYRTFSINLENPLYAKINLELEEI